jgi:transcriptional/translational regulatory protein YebC/TACO1
MAGHSKWSKVKHIKGPLDQKRGILLTSFGVNPSARNSSLNRFYD